LTLRRQWLAYGVNALLRGRDLTLLGIATRDTANMVCSGQQRRYKHVRTRTWLPRRWCDALLFPRRGNGRRHSAGRASPQSYRRRINRSTYLPLSFLPDSLELDTNTDGGTRWRITLKACNAAARTAGGARCAITRSPPRYSENVYGRGETGHKTHACRDNTNLISSMTGVNISGARYRCSICRAALAR